MSGQDLGAVKAEIVAVLQRDETHMGDVWRGTQAGKSPELIAAGLGADTSDFVLKNLQVAQAIVTGELPSATRMSRECALATIGFLERHTDSLSDAAKTALAKRIQRHRDL